MCGLEYAWFPEKGERWYRPKESGQERLFVKAVVPPVNPKGDQEESIVSRQ